MLVMAAQGALSRAIFVMEALRNELENNNIVSAQHNELAEYVSRNICISTSHLEAIQDIGDETQLHTDVISE